MDNKDVLKYLYMQMSGEFIDLKITYDENIGIINFHYAYAEQLRGLNVDKYSLRMTERGLPELTRIRVDGKKEIRVFHDIDSDELIEVISKIHYANQTAEQSLVEAVTYRDRIIDAEFDIEAIEKEKFNRSAEYCWYEVQRYFIDNEIILDEHKGYNEYGNPIYRVAPTRLVELKYALEVLDDMMRLPPFKEHNTMTMEEFQDIIKQKAYKVEGEDGQELEVVEYFSIKDIYMKVIEGRTVLVDDEGRMLYVGGRQ